MKPYGIHFCLVVVFTACGTTEEPTPDVVDDVSDTSTDTSDSATDTPDTTPTLQWYETCGDPVCSGHTDRGVTPCDGQVVGAACSEVDAQCDPIDDCNALLRCTDRDPRLDGCPISRQAFKHNIHYLDAQERQHVAAQVLQWPLATWQYRGAPDRERIGFVLEDLLSSPAADPDRDQVDLYAALSMAIATLQVQADQIAALQAEVEALRRVYAQPTDAGAHAGD